MEYGYPTSPNPYQLDPPDNFPLHYRMDLWRDAEALSSLSGPTTCDPDGPYRIPSGVFAEILSMEVPNLRPGCYGGTYRIPQRETVVLRNGPIVPWDIICRTEWAYYGPDGICGFCGPDFWPNNCKHADCGGNVWGGLCCACYVNQGDTFGNVIIDCENGSLLWVNEGIPFNDAREYAHALGHAMGAWVFESFPA